jgi:energy-converting hydrogenase Eha subunit B
VIRGVLTGDSALTDLEGGQLTLDLGALLERFQTDLVDAGFALAAQIDLGGADRTIVLVEGEQLRSIETARSLVGQLESLSWLLFLATVGVAVGSVVVAPDRRRGMMRLGVGVAFSMVLVAIGLSIARRAFLGAITEGLPRPVASSFFDAVSESMRTGFRGTFVFGLVAALLVLVASRHDFADRWARPTQITVGALGVLAILAREEPNGAYVIFMAVITVIAIAALEAVKRRRLRGPVAPQLTQ